MTEYLSLPEDLPAPQDDGAADHLPGLPIPQLTLANSGHQLVDFSVFNSGRTVLYLYPRTGRPGVASPAGWDAIPGARGCTPEACGFRDHFQDLQTVGVSRVWGLSSQDPDYQAEVVGRLHLPFGLISDPELALADALNLPTFAAPGHHRLYARLTLIVSDGHIERAFYPVFPPDSHAREVLTWLQNHSTRAR